MEIGIDLINFIDRAIAELEKRIDLKISALREEYLKSEARIAESKRAVDQHFDAVNNLHALLDKQATTFQTDEDVNKKIDLALANRSAAIVGIQTQMKVIWALLTALILLVVKEYLVR